MASNIHHGSNTPLLAASDPPPVSVVNGAGASPFLFIGDHAGNVIPSRLDALGLGAEELGRHIAIDIGVHGLGERLAEAMDATFIRQTYSRLVVDCNRYPDAPDAVAQVSDGTAIPANADLTPADRAARFDEIHEPYQRAIGAEIARRIAAGVPPILISLHSFTPALRGGGPRGGSLRPWHVGVLHDAGRAEFARAMLAAFAADGSLVVGDNEPYRMDTIDYTVPRHAYPAGLAYAELEVRQDLIGDDEGQRRWATIIARALATAATGLDREG
ncbi:N-formylglutamate amidohydrolase [Sphingomonas sp.]|uniref:N-formylglutamate amidohydrolase n=1 Tax=Sphingomonas sp. TaxID=28214 RepID=UPI003B00DBC7